MSEKTDVVGCCVLKAIEMALSKAKKIRITIEIMVDRDEEDGNRSEDNRSG